MLDIEIRSKLRNLPNFLGVFARDTLPAKVNIFPHSLIANTDEHDEAGTHWIGIYVDEVGRGDYFDSYALGPLFHEFIAYLERNCKAGFSWNRIPLQCTTCVTCGEYCCAYLILRTAGKTHDDFMKLFTNNRNTNDYIIKSIFKVLNPNDDDGEDEVDN